MDGMEKDPRIDEIDAEIRGLEILLRDMDYVGVAIATGRGTIEEYAKKIKKMNEFSAKITELRDERKKLVEGEE